MFQIGSPQLDEVTCRPQNWHLTHSKVGWSLFVGNVGLEGPEWTKDGILEYCVHDFSFQNWEDFRFDE